MKIFNHFQLGGSTNSKRTFIMAAYHNRHSLTWRWVLTIGFGGKTFTKHFYKTPDGYHQMGISVPGLIIHYSSQAHMWWKDVYRHESEEKDREIKKLKVRNAELYAYIDKLNSNIGVH